MLAAFSRFFLCGEAAVARFCSQDGRKRRQGASLHGPSMAFGAPLTAFLPLFVLAALFRAFSAAPRRPEGPHSRVFRQPGKKTLQRGPLVAFSAAKLLFAWVDSARLLSSVRGRIVASVVRIVASVVRIVALGPRIVALVSAKYHLCVRGPSCSKAFLCRFVANTCGFLVRVHGVR